jgi:hypothetical protein
MVGFNGHSNIISKIVKNIISRSFILGLTKKILNF